MALFSTFLRSNFLFSNIDLSLLFHYRFPTLAALCNVLENLLKCPKFSLFCSIFILLQYHEQGRSQPNTAGGGRKKFRWSQIFITFFLNFDDN